MLKKTSNLYFIQEKWLRLFILAKYIIKMVIILHLTLNCSTLSTNVYWSHTICQYSWGCKDSDTTEWLNWTWGFPGGVSGKESSLMVGSLGWEDPLEEGMATHLGILAWRIPWTEKPGRLWSIGSQRLRQDWSNLTRTHLIIGDGR